MFGSEVWLEMVDFFLFGKEGLLALCVILRHAHCFFKRASYLVICK